MTGVQTCALPIFGYYFEISNANKLPVPAYYVRKQTLVNAERYITPELKEFETKALSAKEKTEQLELKIYQAVKAEIRPEIPDMQKTARALAAVDCLASLARAAIKDRYIRPSIISPERMPLSFSPETSSISPAVFVP